MEWTILSIAYPLSQVGPDSVGGSEQILTLLDGALTSQGHHSIVIAAEGSTVTGTLVAAPAAPRRLDDSVRNWGRRVHQQLIKETLERYHVDLVHMHSLDFHTYLPAAYVPVLATLHLPPDWYPPEVFQMARPDFRMNCVSWSQHRACPPAPYLLDPIPNGVDVGRLAANLPKHNYALALGRICPEKTFHLALDAARQSGTNLLLAGQVFPYDSHLEYFAKEIRPRLDKRRRFLGPVGFARKKRLLAQARCLVIPSTVSETSSLVAMEALACGTPVIASRSGALPEIVEHGRTGFIVNNVDEMAWALREVSAIDPEECRRVARSRFSACAMSATYLNVYERMIQRHESKQQVAQWTGQCVTTP
jgi:glycosyltransferase involved in cell wall biosynthesis